MTPGDRTRARLSMPALTRALRPLLMVLALLLGQHAAQAHALVHLAGDLQGGFKTTNKPGQVGHPAAQCLLFHAIDSAPPPAPPSPAGAHTESASCGYPAVTFLAPPRLGFDSRAPPRLG